jgi:hypothetical protein
MGDCHMSGAKFVVFEGHDKYVSEHGSQPHVWGFEWTLQVSDKE